jgi:hypothetical protein
MNLLKKVINFEKKIVSFQYKDLKINLLLKFL